MARDPRVCGEEPSCSCVLQGPLNLLAKIVERGMRRQIFTALTVTSVEPTISCNALATRKKHSHVDVVVWYCIACSKMEQLDRQNVLNTICQPLVENSFPIMCRNSVCSLSSNASTPAEEDVLLSRVLSEHIDRNAKSTEIPSGCATR